MRGDGVYQYVPVSSSLSIRLVNLVAHRCAFLVYAGKFNTSLKNLLLLSTLDFTSLC